MKGSEEIQERGDEPDYLGMDQISRMRDVRVPAS